MNWFGFRLNGLTFATSNITMIQDCRRLCLTGYKSLFFINDENSDYHTHICSLYKGDRYHPTRQAAWVLSGFIHMFASHRLCFSGKIHEPLRLSYVNLRTFIFLALTLIFGSMLCFFIESCLYITLFKCKYFFYHVCIQIVHEFVPNIHFTFFFLQFNLKTLHFNL